MATPKRASDESTTTTTTATTTPSPFGVVLSGEEAQIRNVYVASLPAAFTDAELLALFSPFGKIVSCKMFNNDDRPTSQGRAYGFVMFEQPEGADRAIEGLMGAVVGSQRIQVRRAKPPGSRPPPPGYSQAAPYGVAPAPQAVAPMMAPYGAFPTAYAVDPMTGMPVYAMPPQPMMMPGMMMPHAGMMMPQALPGAFAAPAGWGYAGPQPGQMMYMHPGMMPQAAGGMMVPLHHAAAAAQPQPGASNAAAVPAHEATPSQPPPQYFAPAATTSTF